ncbi:MAG TPA: class I SAM-dependent methyltransferase [Saprospirales bacterium]|nr:class I SAM-dependent methyltransferase [Saprospirales bacterium]
MNTGKLTEPFRRLGWMHQLDRLKFWVQKRKNSRRNARFAQQHPGVAFPPDYMLFEAFQLDYQKYLEGGKRTADWIKALLEKHASVQGKTLLDWGCGPARVIRHFPEMLGQGASVHGTDYNATTIEWCKGHIPGIQFAQNQLNPPTEYANDQFDFIYGISIFTHLSEANHQAWFSELMRICRPGGLVLLTTHGEIFRQKLTNTEQAQFARGELVVRGNVVEGHRVFAAFHPPSYMRRLYAEKAEVLEHIPGGPKAWGLEQDVWILRRKS